MHMSAMKFIAATVYLFLLSHVVLAAEGDVRLVGGDYSWEGRVEVYHNRAWWTICGYYWDINDAKVVCKSLGYKGAASPVYGAAFGLGSGSILYDFGCTGKESRILDCSYSENSCNHYRDVGVRCQDLRLHGGNTYRTGRLEVFYDGAWGTVCNDYWGFQDANVVCHELGYGNAAIQPPSIQGGSGKIVLDDVQCQGTESRLFNCPSSVLGKHNCRHSEDVGVTCTGHYVVHEENIVDISSHHLSRAYVAGEYRPVWTFNTSDTWRIRFKFVELYYNTYYDLEIGNGLNAGNSRIARFNSIYSAPDDVMSTRNEAWLRMDSRP